MSKPAQAAMRAARAADNACFLSNKMGVIPATAALIDAEFRELVEAAKPFAILGSTVDLSRFDGESPVELVTPAKGKSRGSHRLYVDDITRLRTALANLERTP